MTAAAGWATGCGAWAAAGCGCGAGAGSGAGAGWAAATLVLPPFATTLQGRISGTDTDCSAALASGVRHDL